MKISVKFFFILLSFFAFQQANSQAAIHRYIKKYESMAVEQMKKYQIPASVILGVSIIESGAGQSKLAKVFNNYFGVKGSSTDSKKKLGYQSAYKEYASELESFEHFCKILQRKKFYSKIKGDEDYNLWLESMNKANYAEAKGEWVRKISAAIVKYKLHEFDEM